MKIFDQLAQQRDWAEDERIIIDQVQRVCDEIIAPNAVIKFKIEEQARLKKDIVEARNEQKAGQREP